MKKLNPWISRSDRAVAIVLVLCLAGVPAAIAQTAAQQNSQSTPEVQTNTANPPGTSPTPQSNATSLPDAPPQAQQGNPNSTLVPDPSKGPLQPAPVPQQQTPAAPAATSQPQTQTLAPGTAAAQQAPQRAPEQPLGAAAAESGTPAGGLASKPAGNAIAPAKQRQVRSMLIKVGAIAAGVAALGAVYGLTRATKSTPPGTASASTAGH